MADDPNKSRRAIDLHTAGIFGKFETELEYLKHDVKDLKEEVKGSPHQPGLAEQVRRIFWIFGAIVVGLSWLPWIWENFISKTGKIPVFGEEIRERWIKESEKRIRIYNKKTKQWDYYYAIEESKDPSGNS